MIHAPLRFSFVISRYGADILGGAEQHARSVAERLVARGHDVRVLTSCARSYRTWKNELPPGASVEDGVNVVRYAVEGGRSRSDGALKYVSSALPNSSSLARAWMRAQGPAVPGLVACLPDEARARDLLVFFQLLATPTLVGLPAVAEKSVLVPLVHDERGIRTTLARKTLEHPRALLINTPEEGALIASLVGPSAPPMRVVGVGLETPPPSAAGVPWPEPYVVAMGRSGKLAPLAGVWRALAGGKGLPGMIVGGRDVPWSRVHLVVVGERSRVFADLPRVVEAGYVDKQAKWDTLRRAAALINPSLYESLSLVLLEAWTASRPVVVNAACEVTAGLVRRSGGGVAVDFSSPGAAATAIANQLAAESNRLELGRRGHAFAAATFDWDRVLTEYEEAALA